MFTDTSTLHDTLPALFRIGRAPEPLAFPPYEFCGRNRFDDPLLTYGDAALCFRVLYFGEDRLSCFLEVLQNHRPDLAYLAHLNDLPDGDNTPDLPSDRDIIASAHFVARDVLSRKRIQQMQPDRQMQWVDLRSLTLRESLRAEFARELRDSGATDLDLSAMTSGNRALTQAIARWLYEKGHGAVTYTSHFGCDYHCVALFEGASFIATSDPTAIVADDPDLGRALRLFGLLLDQAYITSASR